MDKLLVGLIVVVAVFLVGLVVISVQDSGEDSSGDVDVGDVISLEGGVSGEGEMMDDYGEGMMDSEVKVFVLTGENFKFRRDGADNLVLRVNEGDRVRIEFSSVEGFHDWVLEGYGVSTDRVNAGEVTSVEFVADKKGVFDYYCSVGSHRAAGMEGSFVVE